MAATTEASDGNTAGLDMAEERVSELEEILPESSNTEKQSKQGQKKTNKPRKLNTQAGKV